MKHLKIFEDFQNELESQDDMELQNEIESQDEIESEGDDYDEKLETDLSVELENKLRTLDDDSDFAIDDFLIEFEINPTDMTGFAWAAILNNTKQFKEMSDEEFEDFYTNYESDLKK